MIDVGAHHGTSLAPFLRAGWRCFAFEPVEPNRARLRANFPDQPLLVVRPEAVSDAPGSRSLHLALNLDGTLHEYHHSLERFGEDAWHKKGPAVEVPVVSLDDLVARGELPERVGFLKVDTEGHDLGVLRGAARLGCEVVSVEFWNDGHAFGPSPSPAAEMARLLGERGYTSFITVSHHLDQTKVFSSTLDGTRPDSWGNLIFFHGSRDDLYRRVLADPDWQFTLEQSCAFDRLNNQLREKQVVLENQIAALTAYRQAYEHQQKELEQLRRLAAQPLTFARVWRGLARRVAGLTRRGRARGAPGASEVGGQRTEDRGQRTEVRGQRTEVRGPAL
jgi:FkbM family methyltransferase